MKKETRRQPRLLYVHTNDVDQSNSETHAELVRERQRVYQEYLALEFPHTDTFSTESDVNVSIDVIKDKQTSIKLIPLSRLTLECTHRSVVKVFFVDEETGIWHTGKTMGLIAKDTVDMLFLGTVDRVFPEKVELESNDRSIHDNLLFFVLNQDLQQGQKIYHDNGKVRGVKRIIGIKPQNIEKISRVTLPVF